MFAVIRSANNTASGANMIDLTGVQEIYGPILAAIEDAGPGAVRFIYCIERGGELFPVVSIIRAVDDIMRKSPMFQKFYRTRPPAEIVEELALH